jgi:glucose-6-phosphate 1-dehydrogenase
MAEASKPAAACTLVIFGAMGDLTKRLLMPALYNLAEMTLLDPAFKIIGIDRLESSSDAWGKSLSETMQSFTKDETAEFYTDKIDETAWHWITSRLHYQKGDFASGQTFSELAKQLHGNVIFYFAIAARFFGPVAEQLGKAGLLKETQGAFRRLVIEKPFGHDLPSAQALDQQLLHIAREDQLYRIDHFMGKEMVQNIFALRFANGMFEPVWSAAHIDHVQIMAAETLGVEGRGGFYEGTGAMRDMVPNHLFSLLAMTTMEHPGAYTPDAVHSARAKAIAAIKPIPPEHAVRGQYTGGSVLGQKVQAYRSSPNVHPDSTTETYVALRLSIENERWRGVPFYVRTGKCLASRHTRVSIYFKQSAQPVFGTTGDAARGRNVLRIEIEPKEAVEFDINVKRLGVQPALTMTDMQFRYEDHFPTPSRVGYETLFYGAMMGDSTLFQRADNIESAWAAVQPVLAAWQHDNTSLVTYAAGSEGPDAANALIARDGRAWDRLA